MLIPLLNKCPACKTLLNKDIDTMQALCLNQKCSLTNVYLEEKYHLYDYQALVDMIEICKFELALLNEYALRGAKQEIKTTCEALNGQNYSK